MKKSPVQIFLNGVERVGNALPHPATLFGIFALIILVLSAVFAALGTSAIHPVTGENFEVINLLSRDGLHQILTEMVKNFTSFAPLGIVIVAMLGIGLAENSGLISVLIKALVTYSPEKLLTFIIVLSGIISNLASSVGYVLLVPLAGTIFLAIGRHPVAGMAAAFAGVSGGFSANLMLGTIDPLLAGISEEAAHLVDPTYHVNPTANYYFMVASTFLIATLGTVVTEYIVVPRLGTYKNDEIEKEEITRLNPTEKKGVKLAFLVLGVFVLLLLGGLLPEEGILRGKDGSFLKSPVLKGVVALLFLLTGIMGIVYGKIVGKYKNDADVMKGMAESMKSLAAYIVLVFFAAQFVSYFNWSNLGIILAINGAHWIESMNLNVYALVVLFVLFSASINLVMGSASAKWVLLAPIFVPMFMFLGYTPELTQVIYRIGDSTTNLISPMMSFFALIIVYFQKYDSKAGIGTLVATMLPYTIIFLIVWVIFLLGWIALGLPLGPGANVFLAQ
jgi:aminobenzoyl-glutamate transport protein